MTQQAAPQFTVTQPATPVTPVLPASVAPSLNPFAQQQSAPVQNQPSPAAPAGLTTAQLAARYGVNPNAIPSAQPVDVSSSAPAGGLTTAQLAAKYGVDPATIPSTQSNNITPGNSTIAKAANAFVPIGADIGQALANHGNKALYQQALTMHNTIITNLQARIALDQAQGKDTSKLEQALNQSQQTAPQESDFTGTEKTPEQVLGDALLSGLNIAAAIGTAGLAPGAAILGSGTEAAGSVGASAATAAPDFITDEAGNTTATGADNSPLGPKAKAPLFTGSDTTASQTIGQRLFQGARTGSAFGAGTGAANAAQNNGSAGQVLGGAAEGAGIGAVGGAALEGIASKVVPSLFNSPLASAVHDAQTGLNDAEKVIYSKPTAGDLKTVKLKDTSSLFGDKTVPDFQNDSRTGPIIKSAANLPDDIKVSPKNTLAKNEANLTEGITRQHIATAANLSKPEIVAATQTTPTAYDTFMQEHVLKPVIETYGPDSLDVKNTQKAIEISKNSIFGSPKTPETPSAIDFHNGRMQFNSDYRAANGNAYKQGPFGELKPDVSTKLQAGRDVSAGIRDFTQSLLPEDHPYTQDLKNESNLINGVKAMRARSTGLIGQDGFDRFMANNPKTASVAKAVTKGTKMAAGATFLRDFI